VTAREVMRQHYELVQHCNGVTKFKQVENKATKHVFGKWNLSRCDESCMGTEISLQFGRHIIHFAVGD